MVSIRGMVNIGVLTLLVILLIFANFQYVTVARGISNFTHLDSSCKTSSCVTFEDKRAVPIGANPLHNRYGTYGLWHTIDFLKRKEDLRTFIIRMTSKQFSADLITGTYQSGYTITHLNMKFSLECTEQTRCRELAMSSSFYRSVYSEIEEVGWEHLVRLGEDLTFLSFRVLDKTGTVHILEIQLDKTYPKCPPTISADVPYIFTLEWSINSRLKDVVQQFGEHLEKLQEFWSTLENIDKFLWVVDPKQPSRAMSYRQINIGNGCFITLYINADDPRSLPECRLMGSDPIVNSLRTIWRTNSKRWMKDKPLLDNLASVLETQLPGPPDVWKNDLQVECGICYAQCLPIDDELGAKSGSGTDYTCDNTNCSKAFHSVCLGDWLRSITTTRQSFNVLFGNCPYCSEPVAVKINDAKK